MVDGSGNIAQRPQPKRKAVKGGLIQALQEGMARYADNSGASEDSGDV